MIDYKARSRLLQRKKDQQTEGYFKNLETALKDSSKLDEPLKELSEGTATNSTLQAAILGSLQDIGTYLEKMSEDVSLSGMFSSYRNELKEVVHQTADISRSVRVENSTDYTKELQRILTSLEKIVQKKFPEEMSISGEVSITNLPQIEGPERIIASINALHAEITSLSKVLESKLTTQKTILQAYKKDKHENIDFTPLQESFEALSQKIEELASKEVDFPSKIEVSNFPAQYIPPAVTNVSINSLRGIPKSTSITVTTTPTKLPAVTLSNRRSMIVFNNDIVNTLYIGGSDVSILNGLPILAQTYSPPIDAGSDMTVYGIASTGINVRVLEVSNIAIGA